MVAQAINHDGNPFKYREAEILYESKIISVSIYSKESLTDDTIPSLVDIDLQDNKHFNVTFDFEGTKCGHY